MNLASALRWQRWRDWVPVPFLALLLLYGVWPWLPLPGRPAPTRTLIFFGFSILGEVMNHGVFPAFQREWERKTGEKVEFISSFAGSGTVRNQVRMGVPAHVALLSLELDAKQLAEAHVIPPDSWRALPEQGVVNRTPFVLLTRPGNPMKIRDFSDLARPGVKIVHPDPMTSGGANWAILAEYGAGFREHPDVGDAGKDLLVGIWRNIVAQSSSARAARTQFENGFGDVLVTYEQELLYDQQRGKLRGEIIYPRRTILSEHTLVVVPRNVHPQDRALVKAFVEFLWSDSAQRIFVQHGFRSVNESLNRGNEAFGHIADVFKVEDFGGWSVAKKEIVDGIWKARVLKEVAR